MRGGRRDAPTEASNSLDAPRREQWLSASHLIRLVRLEPWGTRLTRPGARDRPVRHDEAHVSLQYSSGHPRLVFELGITSAVTPVIPEEVPGFSILPRSGLGTSLSAESDRLLREGPRVRIPLPPADSLVSRRNSPVTVEKPRSSASVAGRSSQRGRQRRA